MASKGHQHDWHPISWAMAGCVFCFKTKEDPGPPKPRGYVQPEEGDPVLWSCKHSWSEYDAKTRRSTRHHCTAVITHPHAFRLRTKGEWKPEWDGPANTAPETPQTPPRTARERLEAARRLRSQQ